MKKLIVLVLFLLLTFLIFPVFGEKQQPESCCSDCSHMPVAKNSNDHDCQILGPIISCCDDMSLRTKTYTRRSSDFHRVNGDLCEIAIRETYAYEECRNCGADQPSRLIREDVISHSHPSCPF